MLVTIELLFFFCILHDFDNVAIGRLNQLAELLLLWSGSSKSAADAATPYSQCFVALYELLLLLLLLAPNDTAQQPIDDQKVFCFCLFKIIYNLTFFCLLID